VSGANLRGFAPKPHFEVAAMSGAHHRGFAPVLTLSGCNGGNM